MRRHPGDTAHYLLATAVHNPCVALTIAMSLPCAISILGQLLASKVHGNKLASWYCITGLALVSSSSAGGGGSLHDAPSCDSDIPTGPLSVHRVMVVPRQEVDGVFGTYLPLQRLQ